MKSWKFILKNRQRHFLFRIRPTFHLYNCLFLFQRCALKICNPTKYGKTVLQWTKHALQFLSLKLMLIITAHQHSLLCRALISYDRFRVRPSVRHSPVSCQNDSSYDHAVFIEDSPWNSKGNTGSRVAKWEWGKKNKQFLANKWPYLRNDAI